MVVLQPLVSISGINVSAAVFVYQFRHSAFYISYFPVPVSGISVSSSSPFRLPVHISVFSPFHLPYPVFLFFSQSPSQALVFCFLTFFISGFRFLLSLVFLHLHFPVFHFLSFFISPFGFSFSSSPAGFYSLLLHLRLPAFPPSHFLISGFRRFHLLSFSISRLPAFLPPTSPSPSSLSFPFSGSWAPVFSSSASYPSAPYFTKSIQSTALRTFLSLDDGNSLRLI